MKEELTWQSITAGLTTLIIGKNVYYYPQVSSTMEIARQKMLEDAVEGTLIIAGEQIEGRGRLERRWQSPKGCIAMSIIMYPQIDYLPRLIMLASLAVVNTIRDVAGIESNIKWPNDVLINGRKVSGILVESGIKDKNSCYATIGIGINVNFEAGCLEEVALPATSLSDELGRQVSRLEVVRKLLQEIEKLYLSAKESTTVFQKWRDNLETLGRQIDVRSGESVYSGLAESVAEDGSLNLRLVDGSLKKITAGDVTLQNQP
ncbi:biotin--[acetyl-CoA-carboxylase] ligase [Chloroflexota bacterium]